MSKKKTLLKLVRELTAVCGEQKGVRVVDQFPEGADSTDVLEVGAFKFHYMVEPVGELGNGFHLLLRPISRDPTDLLNLIPECASRYIELPPSLRTAPFKEADYKPHILKIEQVHTETSTKWAYEVRLEPATY